MLVANSSCSENKPITIEASSLCPRLGRQKSTSEETLEKRIHCTEQQLSPHKSRRIGGGGGEGESIKFLCNHKSSGSNKPFAPEAGTENKSENNPKELAADGESRQRRRFLGCLSPSSAFAAGNKALASSRCCCCLCRRRCCIKLAKGTCCNISAATTFNTNNNNNNNKTTFINSNSNSTTNSNNTSYEFLLREERRQQQVSASEGLEGEPDKSISAGSSANRRRIQLRPIVREATAAKQPNSSNLNKITCQTNTTTAPISSQGRIEPSNNNNHNNSNSNNNNNELYICLWRWRCRSRCDKINCKFESSSSSPPSSSSPSSSETSQLFMLNQSRLREIIRGEWHDDLEVKLNLQHALDRDEGRISTSPPAAAAAAAVAAAAATHIKIEQRRRITTTETARRPTSNCRRLGRGYDLRVNNLSNVVEQADIGEQIGTPQVKLKLKAIKSQRKSLMVKSKSNYKTLSPTKRLMQLPLLFWLLICLALTSSLSILSLSASGHQHQHHLESSSAAYRLPPPNQLVNGRGGRRMERQSGHFQSNQQRQQPANIIYLPTNNLSQQLNVPYKTLYVTRACEWKSNLFVPKSNDILFAQAPTIPTSAPSGDTSLAGQQTSITIGGPQNQESSVVYADLGEQQLYQANQLRNLDQTGRTMLSTESKALILSLPISMPASFAGYEPACAIRLIVPKNMRILAKLSSRRLTFAQQQLDLFQKPQELQGDSLRQQQQPQPPSFMQPQLFNSLFNQQPQVQRQLWLNVSQNQFMETEQRVIETEGNVLAFRFLLERFASRKLPETRFQVIVTAFQTLGENSDLVGANGPNGNQLRPSSSFGEPNAQFICDQQRLISANLACDGFKNCIDGQDEEPATCAALVRNQQHPPATTFDQQPAPTFSQQPPTIATSGGGLSQTKDPNLTGQASGDTGPVWVRMWQAARDTRSLAGFLLGFVFVIILLTCCTCCLYMGYLYWRQHRRNNQERNSGGGRRRQMMSSMGIRGPSGSLKSKGAASTAGDEAALAAAQNELNAAKLRAAQTTLLSQHEPSPRSQAQSFQQPTGKQIQQLQSILKRPGTQLRRPLEPPPEIPGAIRRGALSSSLSSSSARVSPGHRVTGSTVVPPTQAVAPGQYRPTPARRNLTRPTRDPPSRPGPIQERQQMPQLPPQLQQSVPFLESKTGISPLSGRQERITTYHYTSGSTRLSESYLQSLPVVSPSTPPQQQQQQQLRVVSSPEGTGGQSSSSPPPSQSSLI